MYLQTLKYDNNAQWIQRLQKLFNQIYEHLIGIGLNETNYKNAILPYRYGGLGWIYIKYQFRHPLI